MEPKPIDDFIDNIFYMPLCCSVVICVSRSVYPDPYIHLGLPCYCVSRDMQLQRKKKERKEKPKYRRD